MKELEVGKDSQKVEQLEAEKTDLVARVQNLETIVCSVDFELTTKLNQLASRQLLLEAAEPQDKTIAELAPTATIQTKLVKVGEKLADRFLIERELGAGGMGAVYLAQDEQLGEPVALKVIAGLSMFDPHATERLRREASAARRVSHPNVVRLYDIGEADGLLFLSMEYISGTSLGESLDRHGSLPLEQTRAIVAQICKGLEAAHDAGVVHRDLKPGNVLIDEQQQVKIIDFGLARLPQQKGLTATGVIVGTPEYMAPEQIRGGPVDQRCDIYSLGAILFHALTGSPPFSGDTPIETSFAHCTQPVPSLQEKRPDLNEGWDKLIEQAMAKDPAQRFESAVALAAALPPA